MAGGAMSERDQADEFDPEEQLEAGLGDLSPENIVALNERMAAEYGELGEVEVEDEPLDEDEMLLEDEEGGG
jgi:hypothetical protein